MKNKIFCGDALEVLKTLPAESINCCMTSPPYWALRNYNIDGQLGLEKTFQEYVNKLCDVFDEVKRVLRSDGTCWVNMGDTYWGGGNNRGSTEENLSEKQFSNRGARGQNQREWTNEFLTKSLCNIPARFSIEMQNRGWILRNVIIWHKPNCMPCSVKDRFTVDFEYLFFFVKNKKYWFETQYDKYAPSSDVRYRQKLRAGKKYDVKAPYKTNLPYHSIKRRGDDKDGLCVGGDNLRGRNKRCVWSITTKPFKEAHFATYPEELCEIPLNAGCPVGGVVLDCFFGAGTTGLVALKQNKKFVGIELNPEYVWIAEKRLSPLLEQKRLL